MATLNRMRAGRLRVSGPPQLKAVGAVAILVVVTLFGSSCGSKETKTGKADVASADTGGSVERSSQQVKTRSGLRYVDLVEGTGPSPRAGQTVTIHFVGTLMNGLKFDSTVDRNEPYSFVIGRGKVIKGWDEGVISMKVGGKRRLIIPPDLAYGPKAAGDGIPPNSTLIFEMQLLSVQ